MRPSPNRNQHRKKASKADFQTTINPACTKHSWDVRSEERRERESSLIRSQGSSMGVAVAAMGRRTMSWANCSHENMIRVSKRKTACRSGFFSSLRPAGVCQAGRQKPVKNNVTTNVNGSRIHFRDVIGVRIASDHVDLVRIKRRSCLLITADMKKQPLIQLAHGVID